MNPDRWIRKVALRLRSLVNRREVERELDEELQYHVEQQTAENIRQGMTPEKARLAAVQALGGLELQKEQVRDTRGTRGVEELGRDFVVALRSLRRAPGFALAVVLTLALGIGANTAMFTLLRGTLLRALPNRDSDRLVYIRQSAVGVGDQNTRFSVPEVADYRAQAHTLASLAEYSSSVPFTLVGSDGAPARVRVGVVSGGYFTVMGLEPVLGRLIADRDDGPAATSVAVLSHQYWVSHFGGDSGIVGETVRLNGIVSTVIGIVQPAPHYPQRTDVFVNIVTSPHHLSASMVTERTHRMTELFARLAPGATVEQAQDEVARVAAALAKEHPEAYEQGAQYAISLASLRVAVNQRASLTFWLLMGAAAFVLLIACANVANLTLMRGVAREREMIVRATLGAGRMRLRRLLLVENLALALAGGALGVLVAFAALRLLVAFAAQFSPRAAEIRIDGIVLAVGLGTSVVAAFVLSLVPSIGGTGSIAGALSATGRRTTLGRGGQRFQRLLVVAQLAVSMVLLTGAGLLVRTLSKLQSVDTGVHGERVLTLDLPLSGALEEAVMKQPENVVMYERLQARVAGVPGVEAVSLASLAPLRSSIASFDVKGEGQTLPPNTATPRAALKTVDPHYFGVAGVPLLRGRTFASTDRRESARVAIINESLARQLFGDVDPIGRRVAWTGEVLKFSPLSGEWRTVVGVVGDTRDEGLENAPTPSVYEPFAQEFIMGATLVVRAADEPGALQPAVVRAIRAEAPGQLVEGVTTLDDIRDETVAPRRLNAMFIASFAALALLIAMVGIAGVLAFSVSRRTAEIGIRMSLGADAARVKRMVLSEGGVLLAGGVGAGIVGALLAGRLLRSLLFGVSPSDPTTLGGVALLLSAVGVLACWLPAARAARVDPAEALRAD